mmetsp:Transcript_14794/g.24619  ORF Transcript_14794/g.24619 Transcript_14794/m.24619 type:complete len:215 (+) Transcript_14794:445-1089(+)
MCGDAEYSSICVVVRKATVGEKSRSSLKRNYDCTTQFIRCDGPKVIRIKSAIAQLELLLAIVDEGSDRVFRIKRTCNKIASKRAPLQRQAELVCQVAADDVEDTRAFVVVKSTIFKCYLSPSKKGGIGRLRACKVNTPDPYIFYEGISVWFVKYCDLCLTTYKSACSFFLLGTCDEDVGLVDFESCHTIYILLVVDIICSNFVFTRAECVRAEV